MKNLSNLIRGKCGCKADCFSQFRHQLVLDEWLKQRKLMAKMEKLEKDDHVFKLLQAQAEESCRGSRHIRFLGKPVCNKGFMKLVGIGKYRFNTLSLAAHNGEQFCPYDGRYMMKEKKAPSEKWLAAHNFLTGLYVEIAEPIPDGLNSNKRPRSGSTKRDDPKIDRSKIKHLPHGSIVDYFSQCLAANPGLHISRKLFSSVWQSDFQHLLRIRFATHHSKCSLCIKHRLLVKKLGHCQAARNAQHAMLQKHLQRQQRDRQVYYAARARSRLCATTLGEIEICAILDSMDAQKHAWPRSRSMSSKEFSSFNRPRLASTTLLVHGHLVMVALSPSLITAGSSRTAELLCCGLTKMAARIDFRSVWLNLQADNCSKEVKNVGTLRLLSMWTALHKIAGAELSFLSSGHSHEDIDALFSLLRAHLERNPELWTPEAFKTCLEGFFACPQNRPNEPTRCVEMLSRYKDWTNWLSYHFEHAKLKGIGGPGAPHCIRLERIGSTGVKRESLDTRFWDKREYSPSPSDVIMRTKQWMSDDTWQPTIFLFLPASVAKRAQGDCPPVFMEKPVNPQSDENKALRRYATLMRKDPFDMDEAARALPQCGATMGPSAALPVVQGRCLEAVPNRLQLVRERPSADDARRYRNARSQQALYKAASQLWMKGVNMSEAIQIVTEAMQESVHQ